ncbi:aldose 1-epimerase family protein [Microbacterium candidum]|uniref:Aldose 1-epimerase family protein n=1 Tax=Microbacterium candidum TaxID=3041922 RepID=A0ABT7MTM2_9MICO|nr:aldose 1-epimerase family protein [Microbacterium sp. ASV49]MDL9977791.1 aldose 1-epimerase family protein [Microbacterium sp. ASV49]
MARHISGIQHTIRAAGYEARIASVGATLRTLTLNGTDIIAPFDADEPRPAMRGAALIPWPNRIADGHYEIEGVGYQLPLTEPLLGNAIHGLAASLDFRSVSHTASEVVLIGTVEPQTGYPWQLDIGVTFSLGADGLTQEIRVINNSSSSAPVGIGGHPYVLAGPDEAGAVDGWTLHVPAEAVLRISEDRLLPLAIVPTKDEPGLDFRSPRSLTGLAVNHAFTDLGRDEDGISRVSVVGESGGGVEVSWDTRCPWVQVYTSDVADGASYRHAVAIEPMTCPPDAFNSKRDLHMVAPHSSVAAGWSIRALRERS